MNIEKFTDRAKGFLQAAQTIAIRLNHQRITPEHVLKALLDDQEGMASGLIQRAGGTPRFAADAVNAALEKIPAVSGSGAQTTPALDNDTVRVLDQAERVAQKAGDSFVTVERMLLALALAKTTAAGQALAAANVTAEALNQAIVDLRGGRSADSASARKLTTLSRSTRATSPRRRATASSIPSSAATRRSAAPSRSSRVAPRTTRR